MSNDKPLAPLIVILGPTASGKSTMAVWLAERIGGEVVACDSTQLYKGFDIGTAKPSLAERRGVPHHLIDVLEPHEPATAGGYREAAIAVLDDLRRRGRVPILTVGTGLYLRALLEGLADVPQRSEELRDRLRVSRDRNSAGYLHRMLCRLDPDAAKQDRGGRRTETDSCHRSLFAHEAAADAGLSRRARTACRMASRSRSDSSPREKSFTNEFMREPIRCWRMVGSTKCAH